MHGSGFDYTLDFKAIDFRLQPELYRVGKGEQGVLLVEPYKSEILPHWRFKTVADAQNAALTRWRLHMGQPVNLSNELIVDARLAAELSERSVAGQIEFWAQLGRSLEPFLSGDRAMAHRCAGDVRPLSEAIASVDSDAGRQRVKDHLHSHPFPHYELVAGRPGVLRRVEADGTEAIGGFVHRSVRAPAAVTRDFTFLNRRPIAATS